MQSPESRPRCADCTGLKGSACEAISYDLRSNTSAKVQSAVGSLIRGVASGGIEASLETVHLGGAQEALVAIGCELSDEERRHAIVEEVTRGVTSAFEEIGGQFGSQIESGEGLLPPSLLPLVRFVLLEETQTLAIVVTEAGTHN